MEEICSELAGDGDGPRLGLGGEQLLVDDDGEDTVLDIALDLVGPHIVRQHEFPIELSFPLSVTCHIASLGFSSFVVDPSPLMLRMFPSS